MQLTEVELERFFAKVNKTDTCWLWTACLNFPNGYGLFSIPKQHGKSITSHRLSYIIHKGEIPEGMLVCHTCDVKQCVNPDHLFVGSYADNNHDCIAKGRQGYHGCPGEKNGKARLKVEQVLEIRRRYDDAMKNDIFWSEKKRHRRAVSRLQADFDATYNMIYHIVKRTNWKGVEPS